MCIFLEIRQINPTRSSSKLLQEERAEHPWEFAPHLSAFAYVLKEVSETGPGATFKPVDTVQLDVRYMIPYLRTTMTGSRVLASPFSYTGTN